MIVSSPARPLTALLVGSLIAAGCSEPVRPAPPPEPGTIQITSATTGPDPDSNGFVVLLDGGEKGRVPATGSTLVADVTPGDHVIRLADVARNCIADGDRTVRVISGRRTRVDFEVPCTPDVGTIVVQTTTKGFDVPASGYLLRVDGVEVTTRLDPNGNTVFPLIRAGTRHLSLDDLPPHCTVTAPWKGWPTVEVGFSEATTVSLAIECLTEVTLRFSVTTTGADPDVDGYTARVEPTWRTHARVDMPIATNGRVNIAMPAQLLPTEFHLTLRGVASNCAAQARGWLGPTAFIETPSPTADIEYIATCESTAPRPLAPGTQLAFARDGGIHLVNSDGTGLVQLTQGYQDGEPAWSPDGRRIAFVRGGFGSPARALYVMESNGTNPRPLVTGSYLGSPAWSPDGSRIAYDGVGVMVIAADGSSSPTTLVANGDGVRSPAWSPDGTRIAFSSDWGVRDNGLDIFVAGLSGGAIMSLTQSRPSPSHRVMPMFDRPAWSPDGRNLAAVGCPADYETCETSWIYLIGVDAPGLRPLAVGRALSRVTWSPDGKTLAYGSGGAIRWIRADGSDRGVLVNGGHSPAWRPVP